MTMTITISSQHYLDDDIVEAKRAARDYEVLVSPDFEVGGVVVRVILDGHHSLAAAKLDGAAPEFTVATSRDHDKVSLIATDPDLFLQAVYMDGDYYDAITGRDIW